MRDPKHVLVLLVLAALSACASPARPGWRCGGVGDLAPAGPVATDGSRLLVQVEVRRVEASDEFLRDIGLDYGSMRLADTLPHWSLLDPFQLKTLLSPAEPAATVHLLGGESRAIEGFAPLVLRASFGFAGKLVTLDDGERPVTIADGATALLVPRRAVVTVKVLRVFVN